MPNLKKSFTEGSMDNARLDVAVLYAARVIRNGQLSELEREISKYPEIVNKPMLEARVHPLSLAILYNQPEVARLLIEHGSDINHTDAAGNTPLTKSIIMNKPELTQVFLDCGADTSIKNNSGFSHDTMIERLKEKLGDNATTNNPDIEEFHSHNGFFRGLRTLGIEFGIFAGNPENVGDRAPMRRHVVQATIKEARQSFDFG